MSDPPDDGEELLLAPEFILEVNLVVRRKDKPYDPVKLVQNDELALAAYLLQKQVWLAGDSWRVAARRLGLTVPRSELPLPTEELAFEATLEPELLELVAARDRARPLPPLADLRRNPGIVVQETPEPPACAPASILGGERTARGPRTFSSRLPVVWIPDPRTGVSWPFWPGAAWGEPLERLVVGGEVPKGASDELLRALVLSGALVGGAVEPPPWAQLGAALAADRYAVLPDAVNPVFAAAARRHFRRLKTQGFFTTDFRQVPGLRQGVYNDVVTLFIQHQLLRAVDRIAGAPARPSYTWFFEYQPGAVLKPHRDRPQCRWNVSLPLDMIPEVDRDEAWPIYFDVEGQERSVRLGIGDAVLYSGSGVRHGRPALPEGHRHGVCFLHYVDDDFDGELR